MHFVIVLIVEPETVIIKPKKVQKGFGMGGDALANALKSKFGNKSKVDSDEEVEARGLYSLHADGANTNSCN